MQYEEEVAAEVLVKRGVKKKLPGFVFLLDLAVVVTVQKAGQKGTIDQDMPGILKLKKMYDSKHVRAEQLGDLVQIWETVGEEEAATDVPGSNIKLRVENPIRLVSNIQRIHEKTQTKVFGMSLKDILEVEENGSGVPFAVQRLCAYMREHCAPLLSRPLLLSPSFPLCLAVCLRRYHPSLSGLTHSIHHTPSLTITLLHTVAHTLSLSQCPSPTLVSLSLPGCILPSVPLFLQLHRRL